MITKELVEYVKGQMAAGKTREEIKIDSVLVNEGWTAGDVDEALGLSTQKLKQSDTTSPVQSNLTTMPRIILFAVVGLVIGIIIGWYAVPLLMFLFWPGLGSCAWNHTVCPNDGHVLVGQISFFAVPLVGLLLGYFSFIPRVKKVIKVIFIIFGCAIVLQIAFSLGLALFYR